MEGGYVGHASGMVIVGTMKEWGEGGNQRQKKGNNRNVPKTTHVSTPGSQAACAETELGVSKEGHIDDCASVGG
jgi:hypothetical protein